MEETRIQTAGKENKMKLHDEFEGTITLDEYTSRELFRVLEEQDKEFINDILDGKHGFTLKGADGRSVELVPRKDGWDEYVRGFSKGAKCAFEEITKTLDKSLKTQYAHLMGDEPQTNMPNACKNCPNHPVNGGSGICHCTLGTTKIEF